MNSNFIPYDVVRLIGRLSDELGEQVILAGGACRDAVHGRSPKDYDLFVLADASTAAYEDLGECSVQALERIGALGIQVFQHYRDGTDVRLVYVIKFMYHGLEFDLMQYAGPDSTKSPRHQCSGFDTNLNMVWMDRTGNITVEPEANAVRTMQVPITRLNKAYFVHGPEPRLEYLHSKFPQYEVDYASVMTPKVA